MIEDVSCEQGSHLPIQDVFNFQRLTFNLLF